LLASTRKTSKQRSWKGKLSQKEKVNGLRQLKCPKKEGVNSGSGSKTSGILEMA
jgi:hypothetical protein